jgi:vacuolar-type H+-ATPase subunit F/Vma7
MPKILAIAQDHVALQLALSGVPIQRVATAEEAEPLLEKHLEGDTDVLLIQDEIRAGFSEFHMNMLKRHKGSPLVVSCPSFDEEESDVDAYLSAIIKPAVGYEIRLE